MKRKLLSLALVMILAIVAVLFASCSALELDAPSNVRYDGTTITWDAVEHANSYTVKINDGEAYPVTTNKFPYAAKGQQFSVTVTAVSDADKIVSSGETVKMFFPLETIKSFAISETGELSWEAIENATAYEVKVDNQVVDTVTTLTYTGIPAGNHTVSVRPVVEGDTSYYSSFCTAKTMNVLGVVAKENITYENGLIRWKNVSGAQYYEVTVNGTVIAEKNGTTAVEYNAENVDFEVQIKAIGNGSTTYNGEISEAKRFIFLDTVTNVRVEDGILLWDEVAGADGYKLEINGAVYKNVLTETSFSELVAGKDLTIRLMPISNDTAYFSDWSAPQSVRILESPEIKWNESLELDGEANNNVYWDLVQGAAGYAVRVTLPDGTSEVKTFGEIQKSFAYAYLALGTYTVEVKSLAPSQSSDVNDSAYSQPITVTRLDAPERVQDNFIKSNPYKVSDGFTVTFKAVSGAYQYKLYQDGGALKTGESTQFTVSDLITSGTVEAQTFNYKIQSVGKVDTVNGRTYVRLSSLTSESLDFQISILPTPAAPSISGYDYSYGEVTGNYGYSIDISGTARDAASISYDLSFLEVGSFDVSVCAKGNGADVLPSNYTAAINVVRLSAPTNIKIYTNESDGRVDWDEISYAKSYVIIFDNDTNPTPVDKMQNIRDRISTEGTTVCMQSIANYYNTLGTVYYMTSPRSATINFVKIQAPGFPTPSFNNNQLIWNKPTNINEAVYNPTYVVYDSNFATYNGDKNGTSMDISYLEGGEEYTFYVKAIGNSEDYGDTRAYINSEISSAVTIYKLASPVVNRSNGKYVWNSVLRATSYVVYVDGELKATYTHEAGGSYEYQPDFDEIGTYEVKVVAIGDNGFTTIDSNPTVINQVVKQLETPEFSWAYSHPAGFSTSGTFDFTITKESPYAIGYSYTVSGGSSEETQNGGLTYSHPAPSTGVYKASVYALGGSFDEVGNYYIDSQRMGGAAYTITLLGYVNVDTLTPGRDGNLTWDAVQGATQYEIVIYKDGAEFASLIVNKPSYGTGSAEQPLLLENGEYVIQIKAVGNGTTVISSIVVEKTYTKA